MTSSSGIIRDNIIDTSLITLSEIKGQKTAGQSVFIRYDGNPLMIETPTMSCPFGVSNYVNERGESSEKWTMQLSFGKDPSGPVQDLLRSMQAFDDFMLEKACENSVPWFTRRNLTKDSASMLYTPLVRFAKDKITGEVNDRYPPTVRFNVATMDGKFIVPTYNSEHKKINLSDVDTKRARVNAILQCTHMWIAGGRFGTTWKAVQLLVVPGESIQGFAFANVAPAPPAAAASSSLLTAPPSATTATPAAAAATASTAPARLQEEDEEDDDDLNFY